MKHVKWTHVKFNETGSVAMPVTLAIIIATVIGLSILHNSTTAQLWNGQYKVNVTRAKQVPQSASVIANALITLPSNVILDKSNLWQSTSLKNNPSYFPDIYPKPYFKGEIGSAATAADQLVSKITNYTGLNWNGSLMATSGTINQVSLFVNDASRVTNTIMDSIFTSPANAISANANTPRTTSKATFAIRNCVLETAENSASWTGAYCISADVQSENWASAKSGSATKQSSTNNGHIELGVIEPPPPPDCTMSLNYATNLPRTATLSITLNATGVVTLWSIVITRVSDSVEVARIEPTGNIPVATAWTDPTVTSSKVFTFQASSVTTPVINVGDVLHIDATLSSIPGNDGVCPGGGDLTVN
jgi:hypothetical protein